MVRRLRLCMKVRVGEQRPPGSPYVTTAALVAVAGAIALIASLWLDRVRARSFEDFYGVYGGRLGIPEAVPEDPRLDPLPGWFFPISAAGQVVLALIAWQLAEVARLRPAVLAQRNGYDAAVVACAGVLVLWVLGTVVLYPGVVDPWLDQDGPFTRLAGTWLAAAAAVVTAAGLVGLALAGRSARRSALILPPDASNAP
jgi:hypothetical protein